MSSKKRWAGLVGFMGFGIDGGGFLFFRRFSNFFGEVLFVTEKK